MTHVLVLYLQIVQFAKKDNSNGAQLVVNIVQMIFINMKLIRYAKNVVDVKLALQIQVKKMLIYVLLVKMVDIYKHLLQPAINFLVKLHVKMELIPKIRQINVKPVFRLVLLVMDLKKLIV